MDVIACNREVILALAGHYRLRFETEKVTMEETIVWSDSEYTGKGLIRAIEQFRFVVKKEGQPVNDEAGDA